MKTKPVYFKRVADILTQRFPPNTPGGPLVLENDKGGAPGLDKAKGLLQVCVCLWSVCVCVCVCVRERESACMHVCVCV